MYAKSLLIQEDFKWMLKQVPSDYFGESMDYSALTSQLPQIQKKPDRVNEVEAINCPKIKKSQIESTKIEC